MDSSNLDSFNSERREQFLLKADIALSDAELRALRVRGDESFGLTERYILSLYNERLGSCLYDTHLFTGLLAGGVCDAEAGGLAQGLRLERLAEQGTFHRLYRIGSSSHGSELAAGIAGSANDLGRSSILRFGLLDTNYTRCLMLLEELLEQYLRTKDISACYIRSYVDDDSRIPFQILEEVKDLTLTNFDSDEERMVGLLSSACRFLRKLHRVKTVNYGYLQLFRVAEQNVAEQDVSGSEVLSATVSLLTYPDLACLQGVPRLCGVSDSWKGFLSNKLDEHLAIVSQGGEISGDQVSEIELYFRKFFSGETPEFQPVLLHGDPGSHNFFTDGQVVTRLIDWEDALSGDPLFDLASLATFHPERRIDALIATYCGEDRKSDSKLDNNLDSDVVGRVPSRDELYRFWIYFLRISLAKTVHRYRFNYTDRPGRTPAIRRLPLALERLAALEQ